MAKRPEAEGYLLLTDQRLPMERELQADGFRAICGVDEAGRGPLAGPVVAAAVIFKDCELLWKARDSKILRPHVREEFYQQSVRELVFAVAMCSPAEIDQLNILQASLLAMERAIAALPEPPDVILVDGIHRVHLDIPSHAITHGDARVAVISAASIIAKVTRDRLMREYDEQFPGYGFARHFGYPTDEHRRLLKHIGPCSIHRRSFHGVREFFESNSEPVAGPEAAV